MLSRMQIQPFDLTTAIAVYGAVLATLGFGLSIWLGIAELRRYRPRVKITASVGNLFDRNLVGSEQMILVEALNIGGGPLTITGVGWLLDNGRKAQFIRPYKLSFPVVLLERKKLTFYFPCRWLGIYKDFDRIVGAFFQDEMGNTWKCRIKKKKIRDWKETPVKGWLLDWDDNLQMFFRQDSPEAPRIPIPG